MLKNKRFSLIRLNRMGITGLVFGLALIVSACGGAVANAPDSTLSNGMEAISQTGQSEIGPVGTTVAIPPASGVEQDVCSLITSADAEALMGQPVASTNPYSELDSDYGETVFSCYYIGNDLTVIVSAVELGSAQTASEMLQQKYVKEQADTNATITEEPGLGEKAYWTIIENGGMFSFLKGSKIFVVGLVGNTGDATAYKAALYLLQRMWHQDSNEVLSTSGLVTRWSFGSITHLISVNRQYHTNSERKADVANFECTTQVQKSISW